MTMENIKRILQVSYADVELAPTASVALLPFTFSFTEAVSPNGMAAWQEGEHLLVRQNCAKLDGSFSQQALNHMLARKLTEDSIDALVVCGALGCTIDLLRVAALLNIPVCMYLELADLQHLENLDETTQLWFKSSFAKACVIFINDSVDSKIFGATQLVSLGFPLDCANRTNLIEKFILKLSDNAIPPAFDYATYELLMRDHPLLFAMQKPDVRHFSGCNKVLDLGCGVGIFLDALRQESITATGVERNQDLVTYGREMGLDIIASDALAYLKETKARFDGIYCSHFVEHLPVNLVEELLAGMVKLLEPNGVLVLVFPDPESIRSQLLGFWRDPEHVRFYHPQLIISMAQAHGLDCEWSSYDEQPHIIESFELSPPLVNELNATDFFKHSLGFLEKFLNAIGLSTHARISNLEKNMTLLLERQQLINSQLQARTDKLWAVNRTWAWQDNAVLKLRKRR